MILERLLFIPIKCPLLHTLEASHYCYGNQYVSWGLSKDWLRASNGENLFNFMKSSEEKHLFRNKSKNK